MKHLAFCSTNQSGEDRIRPRRFLQDVTRSAFISEVLLWFGFVEYWLNTVMTGCYRLISIVFSTISAQSSSQKSAKVGILGGSKYSGKIASVGQRHRIRSGNAFAKLNRRIRVVIYARYSTQEQDVSSIADQIAFCKSYLESVGLVDADISVYSDAEVSGELKNRPGIDNLWRGIEKRLWDVILVEDASRLFRRDTFGLEFVESACDNGIRTICINDYIDTFEEDFGDRLRQVLNHHAKSNHYTRVRIRRRHEALWMMGAAVCGLRSGYKRTPFVAATLGEPARGPHFDSIDDLEAVIIREIYARIADGEEAWIVAEFANQQKLAKCNGQYSPWTAKDINALILFGEGSFL